MFGQPTTNQQSATGASSAQNPSMLDNVNAGDFQATPVSSNDSGSNGGPQSSQAQQHPITTDNPFAAQPQQSAQQSPQQTATPIQQQQASNDATQSGQSAPSAPTAPSFPAAQQQATVQSPQSGQQNDDSATQQSAPSGPVDHEKLAGMKKDAMTHLEPLVDHVGGSPEQVFKTTMMMIQSNDNHTLLDKALDAAKKIPGDKERAEALMDIITEINYFSQSESGNNS